MEPVIPSGVFPREQAEISGKAAKVARFRSAVRRFMETSSGDVKNLTTGQPRGSSGKEFSYRSFFRKKRFRRSREKRTAIADSA
jgi:hypothetical protein